MKEPLDHLRSRKKPNRVTVWIAGDSEVAEDFEQADQDLKQAQSVFRVLERNERPLKEIDDQAAIVAERQAHRDSLRLRAEETSIKFVFQGLSPKKWDSLVSDHPATPEQLAEGKEQNTEVPFNPETFPHALIAACVIEPVKIETDEELEEFLEWLEDGSFNNIEIQSLFGGALMANQNRRVLNLGKD